VCWAWLGVWHVAPGDEAIVSFVSVSREESGARLKTIAAILTALGLAHEVRGDEVTMTDDRQVTFRTFAATTRAVVGHSSIAIIADECARWESREDKANPAKEVLGSLRPTLAGVDNAFEVDSSAPWGTDDYHAQMFDEGDTAHQVVSFAETWIARPTLTEAETHALEPDQRTWQREYAAQPGATVSSAIDAVDIDGCYGRIPPMRGHGQGFWLIDASDLRGDDFAEVGGYIVDGAIVVTYVGAWSSAEQHTVSMSEITTQISARAKANRVSTVFGDQRNESTLRALFQQSGMNLKSYAWTQDSKDSAMQQLRNLMREQRFYLPEDVALRRELGAIKAKLLPSGRTSYSHAGDRASCLVTLAHAIAEKDLYLSGFDGIPQFAPRQSNWIHDLTRSRRGGYDPSIPFAEREAAKHPGYAAWLRRRRYTIG
jgi:hypothetical protein